MKMRRKLLSLSILVLLTIGMLNTLNLGPIGVSATPPPPEYPSVYVNFTASENPQEYLDAYAVPPTIITVEIWTDYSDGENITAYQFSLTWNPSVLKGLEVYNNGSLLEQWWIPPPPFPPTPVKMWQFVNEPSTTLLVVCQLPMPTLRRQA
jgi:hypothetical protein